jgi:hypothetical protein
MDAVRALDDDALQLVESSIIPNLKAWGCACAFVAPKNPRLIRCFFCQADSRRVIDVTAATSDWHPPRSHVTMSCNKIYEILESLPPYCPPCTPLLYVTLPTALHEKECAGPRRATGPGITLLLPAHLSSQQQLLPRTGVSAAVGLELLLKACRSVHQCSLTMLVTRLGS